MEYLNINNAQDPTTQYFNNPTLQNIPEPPALHVISMFKNPEIIKRPLNRLVFQPEVNRPPQKFIAVFGQAFKEKDISQIKIDGQSVQSSMDAYIFDINNSATPEFVLKAPTMINCI